MSGSWRFEKHLQGIILEANTTSKFTYARSERLMGLRLWSNESVDVVFHSVRGFPQRMARYLPDRD